MPNFHICGSPFYLALGQSQCLMAIGRDVGFNTLSRICRFAYQQKVLKTFPVAGYLQSKGGVIWLWHFLLILHILGSLFYLALAQFQCFMSLWWYFSWMKYPTFFFRKRTMYLCVTLLQSFYRSKLSTHWCIAQTF